MKGKMFILSGLCVVSILFGILFKVLSLNALKCVLDEEINKEYVGNAVFEDVLQGEVLTVRRFETTGSLEEKLRENGVHTYYVVTVVLPGDVWTNPHFYNEDLSGYKEGDSISFRRFETDTKAFSGDGACLVSEKSLSKSESFIVLSYLFMFIVPLFLVAIMVLEYGLMSSNKSKGEKQA